MITVIRNLQNLYFLLEGLLTIFIVVYISFKRDFESRNVFLFGTLFIFVVELTALTFGYRIYRPFNWGIIAIFSLTEGGSAFALTFLISKWLYKKLKKKESLLK